MIRATAHGPVFAQGGGTCCRRPHKPRGGGVIRDLLDGNTFKIRTGGADECQ